jgi:photosystem II stability/assembly factor-like uncharacterized protein
LARRVGGDVKIINIIFVGAGLVAAAYALPGELVVISAKEVRPDEDAGFYYLGSCGAGYLYNGSSAALSRVAPCRLLDREAEAKDYYIVWAPEWVGVTPAAFEHLGAAVRLSEYEILVGLERGLGPGALRAVEYRIELIKLEPVTPVEWRFDGEEPPKRKSRAIEAAVNAITVEEYAGYIKRLQDFKTRRTETAGCDAATDYIRGFFTSQDLETSVFEFHSIGFDAGHYPEPLKNIFIVTDHATLRRTRDLGTTWNKIIIKDAYYYILASFWLDADTGFLSVRSNQLVKTSDAGESWEKIEIRTAEPGTRYAAYAMYFVYPNTGWLGGSCRPGSGGTPRGFILKTVDGGRSWVEQVIPSDFYASDMAFYDRYHGWVSEYQPGGDIFYTSDGGATWRKCSHPATNEWPCDLTAVGPKEAWAASERKVLFHTVNGLTWEFVDPGVSGYFTEIEFPDETYGYASGNKFIKTEDGGGTWNEVPGLPQSGYGILAFADKDYGVIGNGAGTRLYRTDDAGKSFVSIVEDMDLTAENVIGERPGDVVPAEIVIIGGHFDSVSEKPLLLAPGAEDNASGTAVAMAAARAFRNLTFDRTVRYIAFNDEESGLIGSRAYAYDCAQKGEEIIAYLNADMVCYDEDEGRRDDYSIAEGKYTWLLDYLRAVGGLYGNRLLYDSIGKSSGSDHSSFWSAGYPAIGAIEGGKGPGGVLVYPYYHTTEDTLDKLHPALGVRFVRDYAATLAHLAGFDDTGVEEPKVPSAAVPFSRPFAVYPNPYCYSTCAGGVNFVGIKSPATVEVYDLAGRRVAAGETLAPGVYIYRVEGRGQRKAGKIVIAK